MVYNIFIIILCIVIIILSIKLHKKIIIDNSKINNYTNEIKQLEKQHEDLVNSIRENAKIWNIYQEKIITIKNEYNEELQKKVDDLNIYFENQKHARQLEMDTDFERLLREKEENLKNQYIKLEQEELEKEHKIRQEVFENIEAARKDQSNILTDTLYQQQRYEALLEPIRQYEMDLNERMIYTVQVPEQGKEDIKYLLDYAAKKIHNPDIISKIIWSEYVKPI